MKWGTHQDILWLSRFSTNKRQKNWFIFLITPSTPKEIIKSLQILTNCFLEINLASNWSTFFIQLQLVFSYSNLQQFKWFQSSLDLSSFFIHHPPWSLNGLGISSAFNTHCTCSQNPVGHWSTFTHKHLWSLTSLGNPSFSWNYKLWTFNKYHWTFVVHHHPTPLDTLIFFITELLVTNNTSHLLSH